MNKHNTKTERNSPANTLIGVVVAEPYMIVALQRETRQLLSQHFDVTAEQCTEEDLANTALALLSEDPEMEALIEATARANATGQQQHTFDGSFVTVSVAALIVLQTHVRFKRDQSGKWTLLVEKKPTDTTLLRTLVSKILGSSKNDIT